VRQYFQPNTGDIRDFVPLLEGIVADIETVVTSNEKEALLLENTLIKKHQPRFNVKLRDDKNYLVLRLDPEAEWPRLEVVRRMSEDGAYYFGPTTRPPRPREALRVVNRHFQLRTCTDHVLHNRRRPCLQYQIKRCPAPCVLPVPREEYAEQVRDVRPVPRTGKNDELLDRLRARMKDASAPTEYERAAAVRDQLPGAGGVAGVAAGGLDRTSCDQDVVGFHREGMALEMVVLSHPAGEDGGQPRPSPSPTRSSRTRRSCRASSACTTTCRAVARRGAAAVPDRRRRAEGGVAGGSRRRAGAAAQGRGAGAPARAAARSGGAGAQERRRQLRQPAQRPRGRRGDAGQAAEAAAPAAAAPGDRVLRHLARAGGRDRWPRWWCSSTASRRSRATAPTSSSGARGNPDDFAAMYEVLSRRLRRARELARESEEALARGEPDHSEGSGWKLPDLIVVDGGKGQLGMALAAARDVGIDLRPGTGLPIIALAKERESEAVQEAGREEHKKAGRTRSGGGRGSRAGEAAEGAAQVEQDAAWDGGWQAARSGVLAQCEGSDSIRPNSAEMFVLAHLRDEAHRFAGGVPPGAAAAADPAVGAVGHRRHRRQSPAGPAEALRERAKDPGRVGGGSAAGAGHGQEGGRGGAGVFRRPWRAGRRR
jgi:excinuclease ABC subunit C